MKDKITDKDRWLFIANPKAGNNRCLNRMPKFLDACRENGIDFDVKLTEYRGHAQKLAARGAEMGFKKFLVLGGDGSVHEVANGLLIQKAISSTKLLLGAAPMGSANDWIRHYGFLHADDLLIRSMIKGKFLLQDAAIVNSLDRDGQPLTRYFINVLGIGFDSYVATRLEQSGKTWWPDASYLWTIFKCLWGYRTETLTVETDAEKTADLFFTVNAGLTRYSGNKMQIVPHADPTDNLLAITLVKHMTSMEVIINLFRLYNGSLGKHPKVKTCQSSYMLVQTSEKGSKQVAVEADGELLGYLPAEIRSIPGAIRVLIPG